MANLTEGEVHLWRKGSTALQRLPRGAVRRVALSGRDPAASAAERSSRGAPAAWQPAGPLSAE